MLRAASKTAGKRNYTAAVIVAGGNGTRMGTDVTKQMLLLDGKPIVVHTLLAYQNTPCIGEIVVAAKQDEMDAYQAFKEQYGITKLRGLIRGGNTGIASLKNALDHIKSRYKPDDMVVIQEATRPMVSTEMISTLLQACAEKGSATFCHSMNEYVQFDISGSRATCVDRNATIALQSPEAHRLSLLNKVFAEAEKRQHPLAESCCTMLLYNLGYDINFVDSSINNIKIAREEDIAAFSALATK